MKQNVTLTSHELLEYHTFLIFASKKARNMAIFNIFGIFGEIMLAFFILEMLLQIKFLSIAGFFLAVLWIVFYPKFLRKKRVNILKSIKYDNAVKKMTILLNDDDFSFYEHEPKHKFLYKNVSEICETLEIYIIFIGQVHVILPKHGTKDIVAQIAKKAKKPISLFEKVSYENAINFKI